MGCRELDITSYFQLIEAPEKSHASDLRLVGESHYKSDSHYKQKTPYSRFFHTVIPNYRYYSPKLGRWLSRDPLYDIGSAYSYIRQRKVYFDKIINICNNLIKYFQLTTNSRGTKHLMLVKNLKRTFYNLYDGGEETRPYSFINNASINNIDYLGLDAAKDHAVDQSLAALDTATSGTKANSAVKGLILLKKLIDGKNKLDDPANQKTLKEIEHATRMFVNEATFDNCLVACGKLVSYLECDGILKMVKFCQVECGKIMKSL